MKRVSAGYRQTPRKLLSVSELRGVDLYNSPTNVSPTRSPDAPNMIRDVPGKVRKRMGYRTVAGYPGRINGVHRFAGGGADAELVHAGTGLYLGGELIYGDMNDARSRAWQMGGCLYILDGRRYLRFDGQAAAPASESAYVPAIVISRGPSGGGTAHEGVNLLGSRWSESFLSDGASTVYQLSFDDLDDDFIEVKVMTAENVWEERTEGVHYTLDARLGTVTFAPGSVPGAPPVDGADNVVITAKKHRPDYESRINLCDVSVLYGVNGAADRLFVTGNPEYPNYDWYSGMNDASYFPDNNYCVLGLNTRIMAYSIIGEKLAAHKSDDEDGRNIIIREGSMAGETAAFPIVNTLQGAGTVSRYTVAYLKAEPLFFSGDGIYAITPADVNGERYTQNRSFYINSVLMEEPEHGEAVAAVYRDFYLLALGDRLYALDSLLKSYEEGAPYSTHQYEAFVFTGIGARVLYQREGRLRFGTEDGDIKEFCSDPDSSDSYTDDGRPVEAYWDTPTFAGEGFYMQKGFKYLALKLAAAPNTGAEVHAQIKGVWRRVFGEFARLRYLYFSAVRFSSFTFSTDSTPKAFGRRLSLPKADKMRFRFKNANAEPFGIYNYALEFRQSGRVK
jgi:hypothetical protein